METYIVKKIFFTLLAVLACAILSPVVKCFDLRFNLTK